MFDHGNDTLHIPDGVAPGTVEAGKKCKRHGMTDKTFGCGHLISDCDRFFLVLGSMDPHDIIKLQRWKKKKNSSGKKPQTKSYVKGKVIDGEHELYTLSIAVMIGVRTSISRTNTELNSGPGAGRRWVTPQDFCAAEKYEFMIYVNESLFAAHLRIVSRKSFSFLRPFLDESSQSRINVDREVDISNHQEDEKQQKR